MSTVYQYEYIALKQNISVEEVIKKKRAAEYTMQHYSITLEWYKWFRSKVPRRNPQDVPKEPPHRVQRPETDFQGNKYDPRTLYMFVPEIYRVYRVANRTGGSYSMDH